MKLVSWNVNGIRAVYKKGFEKFLSSESPDIVCLQETKAWPEQLKEEELNPIGYKSAFSSAEKKGYSGVAVFYKENLKVEIVGTSIGIDKFDSEGRFIIFKVEDYLIYNIYFPSGTSGDIRQTYKYEFLDAVCEHIKSLPKKDKKKVIVCGDYNICHKAIDIHHPDKAEKMEMSGFLPDERAWMDQFSELGFIDSFRYVNKDIKDKYSWWSYRAGARGKNLGWRIDYFFIAEAIKERLKDAYIKSEILGSDHAPIFIDLS